jgi:HPt (histidine-containing phosphotransfer) domain-containing protein
MADDLIYINYEEGLKRMMNNAGFYAKMLTKFKDDNNLNNLDEAMTAGDMEKAKIAVHTLKGVVSNLSLTELHKQTMEMETQIKTNNVNPQQITVLKDIYSKTITEVDKVIAQNG